jgi:hypothetical protein
MKGLTLSIAICTFASFMLALPRMSAEAQEHKSWKELPLNTDLTAYRASDKINLPDGAAMIIFQDTLHTKPNWMELKHPQTIDQDKRKNAIVYLRNSKGKTLDLKELEKPTAKFVKNAICPRSSFYLIEVDYSAGAGSYNGPTIFMIEVKEEKISFLYAEHTGIMKELALMTSLKTGWWPALKTANGCHDVLSLSCRPDFNKSKDMQDKVEFMLIYRRYHFNGQKWIIFEKTESGFWEYEDNDDIPGEASFPRALQ